MRGSSKKFWLPLEALVSFKEPVSVENALLCYASLRSGGEDKHPQKLLVLGWWSLVLFEPTIYKPKIRWHHILFCCHIFWSFLMKKYFLLFIFCISICKKVSTLRRFSSAFDARNFSCHWHFNQGQFWFSFLAEQLNLFWRSSFLFGFKSFDELDLKINKTKCQCYYPLHHYILCYIRNFCV